MGFAALLRLPSRRHGAQTTNDLHSRPWAHRAAYPGDQQDAGGVGAGPGPDRACRELRPVPECVAGQKSRYFGNVRKLPSGRFQARYRGPDGRLRTAAHTFARKSDAARWLTFKEAEVRSGDWIDPDASRVPF